MDLPGLRQSELVYDRQQDLGDSEWSFPFGCELRVDNETFQVPGFYPDLVSFDKRFETSSGAGAHDLSCEFMSGECFVAGGREGF